MVYIDDTALRDRMAAAQAGDKDAYARLLQDLLPIVRRAVFRKRSFLDEADREDLVQDILLSLHAVRGTYSPDRPFQPWLYSIIANRLADKGRLDARYRRILDIGSDFHETFPAMAANVPFEGYGDRQQLMDALSRLPPGQRKAIELLKLKEMSLKEASGVSGLTVASLKISVHRGMKTLKRLLRQGSEQ